MTRSKVDTFVFANRLRVSREACGLSLDKLVSRINVRVSKQCLSKYEQKAMKPKKPLLDAIALALDVDSRYFEDLNITIDDKRINDVYPDSADSEIVKNTALYLTLRYAKQAESLGTSSCAFSPLPKQIAIQDDAIKTSEHLREVWKCGDGAIHSLVRLLERKGILVLDYKLPNKAICVSTWIDGIPVILINPKATTVDRLRFAICKELAILLSLCSDCERFAIYFLLPAKTILEEITGRKSLSERELVDLSYAYGLPVDYLTNTLDDLDIAYTCTSNGLKCPFIEQTSKVLITNERYHEEFHP